MAKWIQKANLKKGAFTAKAEHAGKSVSAYASQVLKEGSHASDKTKKQAVLAKTFSKMSHGGGEKGFYTHTNFESVKSNKDSVEIVGDGEGDCSK